MKRSFFEIRKQMLTHFASQFDANENHNEKNVIAN